MLWITNYLSWAQQMAEVNRPTTHTTESSAQEDRETEDNSHVALPSWTLSGSADLYFRTSLSAPNDPNSPTWPRTAFADKPGFSLGMCNVVATYNHKRAGMVADLVVGPRGEQAVFGSSAPANLINQLYLWYAPNDKITLTMGNFNTFVGYEVIAPTGNFHYSTSYLFSYGPFSHTGLKADIAFSDELSLMVGIFNPTDLTEFNPTGTWSFGAQLGFKDIYLNLLYGDQDGQLDPSSAQDGDHSTGPLFQADLTAGFDLNDKWYVGINASYNATAPGETVVNGERIALDDNWYGYSGIAAYLKFQPTEVTAVGLRTEYFQEMYGGYGAIGAYDENNRAQVWETTLSANIQVGAIMLIPELRLDKADQPVFIDFNAQPANYLVSFICAAVLGF